ncbi:MAG: hypothetical protein R2807_07490 [Chitinophagales bacterium]
MAVFILDKNVFASELKIFHDVVAKDRVVDAGLNPYPSYIAFAFSAISSNDLNIEMGLYKMPWILQGFKSNTAIN